MHDLGIPVLASPLVLRQWGMGQIDIACYQKSSNDCEIVVYEVKSTPVLSRRQKQRLLSSTHFLGELLHCSSRLEIYHCRAQG